MAFLKQTLLAARVAILGLPSRLGSALVILLSIACVVGVLMAMLCETEGLLSTYRTGADNSRAVVMPSTLMTDFGGGITRGQAGTVLDAPGIAKGADGRPLADAEILMWVPPNRGYLADSPSLLGVGPAGLALRPGFKMVSGHLFRAGQRELVAGVQAVRGYGVKIGDQVTLADGKWPIVGIFSAGGGLMEGQLLGDAETIMMVNNIPTYGSVLAQLQSPAAFEPFKQWLISNPTLGVSAERQPDFYLRTAQFYSAFFTHIAYVAGSVMALGALFGSVKIMFAAVSARTRELATLRAMGYAPLPLALSVLLETLLLALTGAALGACAAWLLFSGRMIANFQRVFETAITPSLVLSGFAWAAGLALLAALFPALRAARLAVADALRAV